MTIIAGALFIIGLSTFIFLANTRSKDDPTPGPAALFDTDLDGLSDDDEERLGTNPTDDDTDFDGLSDSAEVNIYLTNPLRAETDGDGFIDGVEVSGGFNPLVPAAETAN